MEDEEGKNSFEESIEEIIERKVEERVEERKEQIIKKTENKVRRELGTDEVNIEKNQENFQGSEVNISRRDFLKKTGLGAIGVGALGLSQVSGLQITKDDILKDGSSVLGGNVDDGFGSGLTADMIGSNSSDPSSPSDSRIWIKDGSNKSQLKVKVRGTIKTLAEVADLTSSEADSKLKHRWYLHESSAPFVDQVGSADGSNSGTTQVTGSYVKDAARNGDGTDIIKTSTLGSFGSSMDTDFAIAFSVDSHSSPSNEEYLMGVTQTGSSGAITCTVSTNRSNAGDIRANIRDVDGNNLSIRTSSGGYIDDGNPHRVVVNKVANTGTDGFEFYVDGTEITNKTAIVDQGFSNPEDFTHDFGFFAENKSGSSDNNANAVLDDVCIFNDSLTSTEATSYNSPWN